MFFVFGLRSGYEFYPADTNCLKLKFFRHLKIIILTFVVNRLELALHEAFGNRKYLSVSKWFTKLKLGYKLLNAHCLIKWMWEFIREVKIYKNMYLSNKEDNAWMLIFVEGIHNYCPPLKEVDVNERDACFKKWFSSVS